jgi:DNA mismatch endonuclease, patch repair protein
MSNPEAIPEKPSLKSGDGGAPQTGKVYRPRTAQATSFLMSRVASTDTRMEVKLRNSLHRRGLRFRKNIATLPGKPDIAFPRERVAIFVDGDYWHARILKESGVDALRASLKTNNREFWVAKLQRNYERDLAVTNALEERGWIVVRLWESELKRSMNDCLVTISAALERRTSKLSGN